MVPQRLELKPGTQVILLDSIDGLSKGARGIVTGFDKVDQREYERDKEAGCTVPPLGYFSRRTHRWSIYLSLLMPKVTFYALAKKGEECPAKRVYSYPLKKFEVLYHPRISQPGATAEATRLQVLLRHGWAMTVRKMKEMELGD